MPELDSLSSKMRGNSSWCSGTAKDMPQGFKSQNSRFNEDRCDKVARIPEKTLVFCSALTPLGCSGECVCGRG